MNVDCTEHVTAGVIVRSGAQPAQLRRARQMGRVLAEHARGSARRRSSTTRGMHRARASPTRASCAAQDRVALEELALIDRTGRRTSSSTSMRPLCAKKRDRVVPDHGLDVAFGDAARRASGPRSSAP